MSLDLTFHAPRLRFLDIWDCDNLQQLTLLEFLPRPQDTLQNISFQVHQNLLSPFFGWALAHTPRVEVHDDEEPDPWF